MAKSKFVDSFLAHCDEEEDKFSGEVLAAISPFWKSAASDDSAAAERSAASIISAFAAFRAVGEVDMALRQTESPIERLMLLALYIWAQRYGDTVAFKCQGEFTGYYRQFEDGFLIEPQAVVGQYRVDFLVEWKFLMPVRDESKPVSEWGSRMYHNRLIVECDGHDFHEKTKEQAKRDKARDRELTKFGYPVFHYTGSEIWNDVFKCAKEVIFQVENTSGGPQ